MKKAGLVKDPLVTGKEFMACSITRGDCRMFFRGVGKVVQPSIFDGSLYVGHFTTAISDGPTTIHRLAATLAWKADYVQASY